MARGTSSITLSLPPFTKAVKWLVLICSAIYIFMLLLQGLARPAHDAILIGGSLIPVAVVHGWIWQLVTYSFLHAGLLHLVFNMFTLWMFGSQFEMDWGTRKFLEFYFFCVIGAALTTIGVGYLGAALFQASPLPLFRLLASIVQTPTVGASGGIFGLLIAFGMLYGNRDIFMFPLPFMIKAKYMVAIWIFIAAAGALSESGGIANFAHLGGALFGWIYLRFIPRRGLQYATSEGFFGFRNRYIRWKRRRAARKFEVYMRKQNQPTNFNEYFDEYGNYKGPQVDKDKKNGESGPPWVN